MCLNQYFWLGIAGLRFKIFYDLNLVLVISFLCVVKSHSWTSAAIWDCRSTSIIYNPDGFVAEDVVTFVPSWAKVYYVSFPVNDSVVLS